VIRIRNLSFSWGSVPVLDGVSLDVAPGEVVGVIGPSGAGKTTLLRMLLGELTPSSGSITASTPGMLDIGYVPQLEAGERSFPLTVREMVLLGAAGFSGRRPWFSAQEKRRATAVLDRLAIPDLAGHRLDELSGGQFQRALIARALMSRPGLLLLDEPTSGIDLATRRQVLDLVRGLSAEGLSVVLTTHDLNWVAARLPRIVCLNRSVIADGRPSDVLTPAVVRDTYGAVMEVVTHRGRPVVVDADEEPAWTS
jgi:ABC-type Mn2+/Zn2+ transport system ATPase subunit